MIVTSEEKLLPVRKTREQGGGPLGVDYFRT